MKKIIRDFMNGFEKIRWFSSFFSERLKIEIAIFKLLYESDRMSRMRDELLRKIGERVMELKNHEDANILRDTTVSRAMAEVEKLDKSMNDLRGKVSDLGRVTD
jgi:hypothetical protein